MIELLLYRHTMHMYMYVVILCAAIIYASSHRAHDRDDACNSIDHIYIIYIINFVYVYIYTYALHAYAEITIIYCMHAYYILYTYIYIDRFFIASLSCSTTYDELFRTYTNDTHIYTISTPMLHIFHAASK